jgi:ABC transport system ATP-binding/permease protein
MAVISFHNVTFAHGGPPLLEGAACHIEAGERVCLLGRNGTGKSTLLALANGSLRPDAGDVSRARGLRCGYLPQTLEEKMTGSVFDVISGGLAEEGELLRRYHDCARGLQTGAATAEDLAAAEREVEAGGAWERERLIEQAASTLSLDIEADFASLSGGQKRRVLLARAIAAGPDLLLLDEPTNHLDIASIKWLERFLTRIRPTLLFVTHDRAFMQAVANRVLELDRGRLRRWDCDYETYLRRREELDAAETAQRREFDKTLAAEEAWLRRGVKARRTRDEGRVRALERMRRERAERRERDGRAALTVQTGNASGQLVIAADGLSFGYDGAPIVSGLDLMVERGDKIGLVGANGCGKTTLLRLLLGEIEPDEGSVRHGTRLNVAYFDQMRAGIDGDTTIEQAVADGADTVTVNGHDIHVYAYLAQFLFPRERARTPVRVLSGGERNRLLLAKLFTRPANVLVLDEPTNDLDLETLQLLEERLVAFSGTILLVSHDRRFLDNVVTSTLVFEGEGVVREVIGGYEEWRRHTRGDTSGRSPSAPKGERQTAAPKPRRLSYRERQELDALPSQIEEREKRCGEVDAALADPATYRDGGDVSGLTAERERLAAECAELYARWQELEGGAQSG